MAQTYIAERGSAAKYTAERDSRQKTLGKSRQNGGSQRHCLIGGSPRIREMRLQMHIPLSYAAYLDVHCRGYSLLKSQCFCKVYILHLLVKSGGS